MYMLAARQMAHPGAQRLIRSYMAHAVNGAMSLSWMTRAMWNAIGCVTRTASPSYAIHSECSQCGQNYVGCVWAVGATDGGVTQLTLPRWRTVPMLSWLSWWTMRDVRPCRHRCQPPPRHAMRYLDHRSLGNHSGICSCTAPPTVSRYTITSSSARSSAELHREPLPPPRCRDAMPPPTLTSSCWQRVDRAWRQTANGEHALPPINYAPQQLPRRLPHHHHPCHRPRHSQ